MSVPIIEPAYKAALVKGGIVGLLTAGAAFFATLAVSEEIVPAAVAAGSSFFVVVLARLPEEKLSPSGRAVPLTLVTPAGPIPEKDAAEAQAEEAEVIAALKEMQRRKMKPPE